MNYDVINSLVAKGLSTRKISTELKTSQSNVRYWLKKYNLQTLRKTNGDNNLKLCPKCKTSKPKDDFYKSTKSSSYCKSCIIVSNKERQRNTKQLAVEYKGGKCSKCGYSLGHQVQKASTYGLYSRAGIGLREPAK